MADTVTVRHYAPADLEAVQELVRGLQADMRPYFDRNLPPDRLDGAYMADLFTEHLSGGAIFVAEEAGRIVGYAMLILGQDGDKDELPYTFAEVKEIMVSASHRGQHIGERLLEVCEDFAKANGERWLRIELLAGNEGAHRLYSRYGFKDHIVTMEKPLSS